MGGLDHIATLVTAAGSGNFLVQPGVGGMIWTLIAFGVTILLLRKLAFPRIQEALDKRRITIEESIDHAERTREEADALLREYRERLREAREQADDIVVRARRAAEKGQEDSQGQAQEAREGPGKGGGGGCREEAPPRRRAGDAARPRPDPPRGGRPDGARHREGH